MDKEKARLRERARHLRRCYGITTEQYETMLTEQGGVCAICATPPSNKQLHVDHNHKTGEIRGLLCWHCNHKVIGANVDPIIMRRAADYLERKTGIVARRNK